MTDFTRAIRKHLSAAGWRLERRGKGDHERWVNPQTRAHVTVDSKIRSRHTANGIPKEAGLEKEF